jgi:hypothetical protein
MNQQWAIQGSEPSTTIVGSNMDKSFDYNLDDPAPGAQDDPASHATHHIYYTTLDQAPDRLFVSFHCLNWVLYKPRTPDPLVSSFHEIDRSRLPKNHRHF